MKTIKCKFTDFNFEKFLNEYDLPVKTLFEINNNQALSSIIEIVDYANMEIDFNFENKSDKKIIEAFKDEKIALFFPIGVMADNRGIYLRLINLIQYRIKLGDTDTVYGDVKNYNIKDDILELGKLEFDIDSTLGLIFRKKENKLYINFAQYSLGSCISAPTLEIKEDIGDLASEVKTYLANYSK